MQKLLMALVLATTAALAGCSSSSDDDDDDNGGMPTAATLDSVISLPADSQPVDDGLDQVTADLLTVFGDANSTPVELDDGETVSTFVTKQGNR